MEGMPCIRSYTPISLPPALMPGCTAAISSGMEGPYFDMLVKIYPEGAVSSCIGRLKLGDSLLCTALMGSFRALEGAAFVGMVAGGTGQ